MLWALIIMALITTIYHLWHVNGTLRLGPFHPPGYCDDAAVPICANLTTSVVPTSTAVNSLGPQTMEPNAHRMATFSQTDIEYVP